MSSTTRKTTSLGAALLAIGALGTTALAFSSASADEPPEQPNTPRRRHRHVDL